jgi:hypothetical protein
MGRGYGGISHSCNWGKIGKIGKHLSRRIEGKPSVRQGGARPYIVQKKDC